IAAIFPDLPAANRILLLGLAINSMSVFWNLRLLQMAILALGGFGLLLYGELQRKNQFVIIGGLLALLKLNMILPVAGFLLWRRRAPILALLLVTLVAVDLFAASIIGVRHAYAGFSLALAQYTAPGVVSNPDAKT